MPPGIPQLHFIIMLLTLFPTLSLFTIEVAFFKMKSDKSLFLVLLTNYAYSAVVVKDEVLADLELYVPVQRLSYIIFLFCEKYIPGDAFPQSF